MGISWVQILIIAVVVILLFGRGKISAVMGDVAKGIKSFKKGLNEDDAETADAGDSKTIDHQATETVSASESKEKTKAG